ncbi:MAG: SHD1 domain-containing protein [Pirellulaceae bacterium]
MLRYCWSGLLAALLLAALLLAPGTAWAQEDDVRIWRDNTGKFSVAATFIGIKDGRVQLRRVDTDQIVGVPIIRLSDVDRQHLIQIRRAESEQTPAVQTPQWQTVPQDPPPPFRNQTEPGQTVPGQTVPGQTVPGQTVPGQTVPGQTVPGQTVPGQTVPGQTVPGQVQLQTPNEIPQQPAGEPEFGVEQPSATSPQLPEQPPVVPDSGQSSTAEIQMPGLADIEPAQEPEVDFAPAESAPNETPIFQQPLTQTPAMPAEQPESWQPPASEFNPSNDAPDVSANVPPTSSQQSELPPPQPFVRSQPPESTSPDFTNDEEASPGLDLPPSASVNMPDDAPGDAFANNEVPLQRSFGDTPPPAWSDGAKATINDTTATIEPPQLIDRATEFDPITQPSVEPVPSDLPSPLATTAPESRSSQVPGIEESGPVMLQVPELPAATDPISNDNTAEPDQQWVPPSTPLEPPESQLDPPPLRPRDENIAESTGQEASPGAPVNTLDNPDEEPLAMEDTTSEPPAMEPPAMGQPPVESPAVTAESEGPAERIADRSNLPSVPEFQGRARVPSSLLEEATESETEIASIPTEPGGGNFTPPPVSPRARSESAPISSGAISLSSTSAAADELIEATDQELLDQITLNSQVRWKGTARLSDLLEPEPPNFEVVIQATGEILDSATHLGFVDFQSVEDVNGLVYSPTVLPPRVANVTEEWVRVTPDTGNQSEDAFRQLLVPEVSTAVEFDRPDQLPRSLSLVSGSIRVRLATSSNVLTIDDVVANAGRVEHELLQEKGVEIEIRVPDSRTLIVETRGNAGEILGMNLQTDLVNLVGQTATDGYQASFHQFNFRSRIPEQIRLEILINNEGRELEIPFRFDDLQLPLEDSRDPTQLTPSVGH